jgi:hypothetical protein
MKQRMEQIEEAIDRYFGLLRITGLSTISLSIGISIQ